MITTISEWRRFNESLNRKWYHGTDSTIDAFRPGHEGKGPSAFGIWFTDDIELAKMFGENVYECEVTFKNPHTISQDEWDDIRAEHAKDTNYFINWRNKLRAAGKDALFINERNITLGRFPVRDPNIVAVMDAGQAKIVRLVPVATDEKVLMATTTLRPMKVDAYYWRYAIMHGGKRAGMVEGYVDGDAIKVGFVEINPKFRGKGIGSAALKKYAALAKADGLKYLKADCVSQESFFSFVKAFGMPQHMWTFKDELKTKEQVIKWLPKVASYNDDGQITNSESDAVLVQYDLDKI